MSGHVLTSLKNDGVGFVGRLSAIILRVPAFKVQVPITDS